MSPNRLRFNEIPDAEILKAVDGLSLKGWIEQKSNYCYLKVDDGFVHQAYPHIEQFHTGIQKPDYFDASNDIGAHISVIYPEEHVALMPENIGQIHDFKLCKLIKAQFETSAYFVLSVVSPSLNRLRQMHRLSVHPVFKGYEIMFHITIGVLPY